ncbi:hypothetical protein ACQR16_14875 [Bradyrhizobium oligotrophicum]|uniref:hypothetical protein n=1 Tax=Bradyrhizobium oligotrophicum TaxID=44255 RepID=UPI003EBDFE4D
MVSLVVRAAVTIGSPHRRVSISLGERAELMAHARIRKQDVERSMQPEMSGRRCPARCVIATERRADGKHAQVERQ